jgi:hypothetical protein
MASPILAIEFEQGIEDAFADVAEFVPKLIGFLVILVIGYLIAKALSKVADAILERVGFDRAVERGGVKQALSASKYDASDIVSKIIFYALVLLVLQMAFGVFGTNPVSDLITDIIAYLPKVFVAIVIIVIASAVAAAVKSLVEGALGGLPYGRMIANIASTSIIGFGAFAALSQLQIAPNIVEGLYYAILALIVGSGIVAIGGGGIAPMRAQWERAMARAEEEGPKAKSHLQARKGTATATTTTVSPSTDQLVGSARTTRVETER